MTLDMSKFPNTMSYLKSDNREIIVSLPPFVFESYFAAETFLEYQGYHCKNKIWLNSFFNFARLVDTESGVHIEFINNDLI